MGFRTVIVNSRAKLEFRLNFMIVRGENEKRVFIDEINTLIVQSTAVSLTAALLSELIRSGVKVIFCDENLTLVRNLFLITARIILLNVIKSRCNGEMKRKTKSGDLLSRKR